LQYSSAPPSRLEQQPDKRRLYFDASRRMKSPSCNPSFLPAIALSVTSTINIHDKVLRVAWWVLGLTVFGLTLTIRIRLLGIPLERDEGEYAYAGQLMLQGIPPYELAYNMKFPGTYAAYALLMSIFGQTITGIHLGLLLVNAATVVLIFFLGRKLINSTAGIAAAASYAVLSVSPSVLGLAGHATHFVLLPVIGGTLLLLNQSNQQAFGRLFASGLFFGLGLLMKQPAFFFPLFGAFYLLLRDIRAELHSKRILLRELVFGTGVVFPFGITGLILWNAHVFKNFWFWTIDYARQYGSLVPLSKAPQIFIHNVKEVIGAGWALWVLAGIGLISGLWTKRTRTSTAFLLGLLISSVLAASAGFYFRYHYFVLALPAVSLLASVAVSNLSDRLTGRASAVRLLVFLLFGAALGWPLFQEKKIFFQLSPVEASRMIYPESPFVESVRIAEFVREHTNSNDTIAVLGSEPEIYFYSNRHSATGYIYTYGLMERQKYAPQMQGEMIREIERTHPRYLIFVGMSDSWLKRPGSEELIFTWAHDYIPQNYSITGLVDLSATDRTHYYFGDIPRRLPQLENYILICERKS
jgi:hypothetical protein